MDKEHLLQLADVYKGQIFNKLHKLVSERMERLERSIFEGKTTEEILALIYIQGVAEALDAFDMNELLRAIARADTASESGIEA